MYITRLVSAEHLGNTSSRKRDDNRMVGSHYWHLTQIEAGRPDLEDALLKQKILLLMNYTKLV